MPLKKIKVDKDDEHLLDRYSIWVCKYGYVICDKNIKGTRSRSKLHQLIIGKKDGLDIDHINGDKLDNRKANLRHVSRSVNRVNTPKRKNSGNPYKGIQKLPYGRWRAKGPNGIHWGSFGTPEEAHEQWRRKTEELFDIKIKDDDYALA